MNNKEPLAFRRSALTACVLAALAAPVVRAAVTLDGTLGPAGALIGPNYVIPDTVGQTRGANLFHSFGQFSVDRGESATFTGPTSIQNVIGRVTGGQLSSIDGLLRCSIPGADLYLVNPSGIMFGPNASLDVRGSFHTSTANYLTFADGGRFDATTPARTVLSVAAPAAFGFLGPPAPIGLDHASLAVPVGKTLSLVGGDITILGPSVSSHSLIAPSGRVELVSLASAGEAALTARGPSVSGSIQLGSIDVRGAFIDTSGDPGGTIYVRGGRLIVTESTLRSVTTGAHDHPGLAMDIATSGEMVLQAGPNSGAEIVSATDTGGRAGDIAVQAGTLRLVGDPTPRGVFQPDGAFALIASSPGGYGRSGDIALSVGTLELDQNAVIATGRNPILGAGSFGKIPLGPVGDISVTADRLLIDGRSGHGSYISTSASESDNAGRLSVVAREVVLKGGTDGFAGLSTQVAPNASVSATAGSLSVQAASVRILDGAQINAGLFKGSGVGGDISIAANELFISGRNATGTRAGIFASAEGAATGHAGNIHITADRLALTHGGKVSSFGDRNSRGGGNIWIGVGDMEISDGAALVSSTDGPGNAGDIGIAATQLRVVGPGADGISVGSVAGTGGGHGGNIRIDSQAMQILDGGRIDASTFGSGAGGSIAIRSDRVRVAGRDAATGQAASIQARSAGGDATGRGGIIDVAASTLTVTDGGIVSSTGDKNSAGAGNIQIATRDLEIGNGGVLASSTNGTGNAGDISITATLLKIVGNGSGLGSAAGSHGGNGGNIRIGSHELQVLNGAHLDASTSGSGAGGSINIHSDHVLVAGGASIEATTFDTPGVGPATGQGGDVTIEAREVIVRDQGLVSVRSAASGDAGNLRIAADTISLSGGALLSATAIAAGAAGSIALTARDALRMQGGTVSTQAARSDGGNVTISAGSLVYLYDSSIAASVQSGSGNGGNIAIDSDFVVLNHSRIAADAYGGAGGNVSIVAGYYLASPDSRVTASSTLGLQGEVLIGAPTTDLSGELEQLPETALDAAARFKDSCTAAGSHFSSFRTPVPASAAGGDGLLPGVYAGVAADPPSPATDASTTTIPPSESLMLAYSPPCQR